MNTSDFLEIIYDYKAYNAEKLGKFVAIGLSNLDIPGNNIHLIGHGLGAHLMGSAGRYFASQNIKKHEKIARITGLDPTSLCFKDSLVFYRLSVDDATFVDIIHSSPGDIGIEEPIGHADFYPGGLEGIQPACWYALMCPHIMSIHYLAESVYKGNEKNFMGSHCDAFANLNSGTCSGTKAAMGYAANKKSKGIYYLEVNGKAPFGKNAKHNTDQNLNTCGICTK